MWGAVLAFALSAMGDPLRIAIAVLLCSRPRPMVNLFMFWLGGMATSLTVGLITLFVLRDFSLNLMKSVASAAESYNIAHIQIVVGVLAVLMAGIIAAGFLTRERRPVVVAAGNLSPEPSGPSTPSVLARMSTRARDALQRGSPWLSFVGGMWVAPGPPVELAGALAVILASGAAAGAQIGAVVLYCLVAFGAVSIPLISHLAAPAKSQAIMLQVASWIRARRRPLFAIMLAVMGAYLVGTGMGII